MGITWKLHVFHQETQSVRTRSHQAAYADASVFFPIEAII